MGKDTLVVFAYSDGSAIGNPGPGGYGVVLKYGETVNELSAGYRHTTNNRMELLGAIVALETLKHSCQVELTSDSRYLIDGISKGWAESWRANGWRRGKQRGKALNSDLWERLLKAISRHNLTLKWVRGHAGHPENERCDQLANQAARGIALPADEEYERINGRVGDV
jgi:ribonuclease HI